MAKSLPRYAEIWRNICSNLQKNMERYAENIHKYVAIIWRQVGDKIYT